jgi:hypothetical protein
MTLARAPYLFRILVPANDLEECGHRPAMLARVDVFQVTIRVDGEVQTFCSKAV